MDGIAGYILRKPVEHSVGLSSFEITSGGDSADTWPTLWGSVADMTHHIHYFQSTRSPNVFWEDVSTVNTSDGAPVIDVDAYDSSLSGDVSNRLKPSKLKI
ncbi:MAG: hypothetical protein EB015_17130 [Methylocystaceae bacterium]|nr:hypothetical protein [Methylocystaceae bacterium]